MIYILLADGFEDVEAIAPADALRRARVDTAFVGVTGMEVTASHGLRVRADMPLAQADAAECEAVVIPGGLRGVENIGKSKEALALVRAAYDAGKTVAAICAGPTILASLGILEGRQAVCYPGMEDQLTGATALPGARVVVDGNVITSRSAGTAWDFALALVEALRDGQASEKVRSAIVYDRSQG